MAKEKKFYVVWEGKNKGVFSTWNECKASVIGMKGAKYKGFATESEAREAFSKPPENYISFVSGSKSSHSSSVSSTSTPWIDRMEEVKKLPNAPILNSLAVDAACSGNPGKMEYRGVYTATGQEIFHVGPFDRGTNNIGEFLAIVHGLGIMANGSFPQMPIYSDSRIGMSWVKQGKCKTRLPVTPKTSKLIDLVSRAESWLAANFFRVQVNKWDTETWGEIPADFGRK